MDIKKYEVPFTILLTVLAVLEIIFFIKILFADSKGVEWGSVTDWVSASCNIAMATAAVYAALQAKKWLKPKLNQNGLPDVIKFLKTDVKTLLNGIVIDSIDGHFIDLIRELDAAIESHREDALPAYNKLASKFFNIKNVEAPHDQEALHDQKDKTSFDSKKSELMWYGYSLKENKDRIIEEIFKLRTQHFQIYNQKQHSAHKIISNEFSELVQTSSVIKKRKSLTIINNVINELEELNSKQKKVHDRLKQLYKELMGDKPAITDFFDIK